MEYYLESQYLRCANYIESFSMDLFHLDNKIICDRVLGRETASSYIP